MDSLIKFNYQDSSVRIVQKDGEPWFVAKDVAEFLGYSETSNPARLFFHIPEEWKGLNPIHTPGGTQEMLSISEQGLYFFLGRSDKPLALPFQKWLAGEVLPAIRKTGTFRDGNQLDLKAEVSRLLDEKLKDYFGVRPPKPHYRSTLNLPEQRHIMFLDEEWDLIKDKAHARKMTLREYIYRLVEQD